MKNSVIDSFLFLKNLFCFQVLILILILFFSISYFYMPSLLSVQLVHHV